MFFFLIRLLCCANSIRSESVVECCDNMRSSCCHWWLMRLHGKPVLRSGKRVRLKYAPELRRRSDPSRSSSKQHFSVELDPWPAFGVAEGCHHQRRRCKFRVNTLRFRFFWSLFLLCRSSPIWNKKIFSVKLNRQRSSLWSMNEFTFKLFSRRVNRQIGADTVPLPSAAPVCSISGGGIESNRKKRVINNHFFYRQI